MSEGIREKPQGNEKRNDLMSIPQPRSGSVLPPDASPECVCVWRMRYCLCNSNNHVNATIKPVTPETRGNGKEDRVAGAVPNPGRPGRRHGTRGRHRVRGHRGRKIHGEIEGRRITAADKRHC